MVNADWRDVNLVDSLSLPLGNIATNFCLWLQNTIPFLLQLKYSRTKPQQLGGYPLPENFLIGLIYEKLIVCSCRVWGPARALTAISLSVCDKDK